MWFCVLKTRPKNRRQRQSMFRTGLLVTVTRVEPPGAGGSGNYCEIYSNSPCLTPPPV